MNPMKRIAPALLSALLLAGCAARAPEPEPGRTAYNTFIAAGPPLNQK